MKKSVRGSSAGEKSGGRGAGVKKKALILPKSGKVNRVALGFAGGIRKLSRRKTRERGKKWNGRGTWGGKGK